MATGQTDFQKFFSRNVITQYDFDPDATSATEIAWVDMSQFERFAMSFFRTVGTSALTWLIVANADSAGGDTDVTILTVTPTAAPDAVGDYAFAEISAEQIADANTATTKGEGGLRYVTASLAFGTGTDEGVVTYVRSGARFPTSGLTADVVA